MSIEQSFQSSLAMRDRPVIAEELIVRQDIPDPISVDSELPRATALVKKLKGYTVENWNNLGDDVVVRGLDALTHGILASWAALDEPYALGWVARSLEKQIGYVPSTFRDLYSYTAIKQIEESPSEEWGRYEVRTSQSFEHRRALTALLIWPELAAKIGVDFWSELMDPLAQLQMNIGNNPAQVSVESRVAGMSIPRETRELVGRIRFAQMARAMGDAIYAFQTYALQAVAQRSYYQGALANDLQSHGIRVANRSFIEIVDPVDLDIGQITQWTEQSNLLAYMQDVVAADFGEWHAAISRRGEVRDVNRLLKRLCVGMIDPGILAPLRDFPWMEKTVSASLLLHPGEWYRFYQTSLGLNTTVV
ncbi:MAG: hypothetical protein UU14_C0016G0010 [Candidatus Roizmanbacteria bacterium GW2011_GWB1_40_7]|uniref:Uncharacterized protein n=2 Tax=Candidatus Roizmaniibacteriota TaxID=1752723 RepID=A0A0G0VIT0_9BACT|nr:MAG: hypothetical protein UU14_C0016G0010 [Candidatus Roizmanbacteria bacterium GW2011_GWB1_40_7]KKR93917.1 MAG: hypothetical protein UU41_C0017G0010 [Candidatus Roizmanbacteria bacterium GW2011_GWA1_41_13]